MGTDDLPNRLRGRVLTWHPVTSTLPPRRVLVETKVSDRNGDRRQERLAYTGFMRCWLTESGEVAGVPTHWRATKETTR